MTRSIRHWTPRYVVDRVCWAWWNWQHPDAPWIAPEASRLLARLLRPTDVGIEFGSGRSTVWLARRIARLVSVEHDPAWFAEVAKRLEQAGATNVEAILARAETALGESSEYVRVLSRFADESIDFALVDGRLREHCALGVLPKLSPGGLLVVDNAERYLDYPTRAPLARSGRGPENALWARFADEVRGWRMAITTSGVTDTILWIKTGRGRAASALDRS